MSCMNYSPRAAPDVENGYGGIHERVDQQNLVTHGLGRNDWCTHIPNKGGTVTRVPFPVQR
eukprot:scaffold841_cov397-Prasinococcus_capsulatus_cf.AAC.7